MIYDYKCPKIRTIFSLFEVFDCEKCKYYRHDERFLILDKWINTYFLNNTCYLNKNKELNKEDLLAIAFSQDLKIFLKDSIKASFNNTIIWASDSYNNTPYDNKGYYGYFMENVYDLLAFENDIHILYC